MKDIGLDLEYVAVEQNSDTLYITTKKFGYSQSRIMDILKDTDVRIFIDGEQCRASLSELKILNEARAKEVEAQRKADAQQKAELKAKRIEKAKAVRAEQDKRYYELLKKDASLDLRFTNSPIRERKFMLKQIQVEALLSLPETQERISRAKKLIDECNFWREKNNHQYRYTYNEFFNVYGNVSLGNIMFKSKYAVDLIDFFTLKEILLRASQRYDEGYANFSKKMPKRREIYRAEIVGLTLVNSLPLYVRFLTDSGSEKTGKGNGYQKGKEFRKLPKDVQEQKVEEWIIMHERYNNRGTNIGDSSYWIKELEECDTDLESLYDF